jgi:hypothetical protein
MRFVISSLTDKHGISRLPLKVLACMLGAQTARGPKASRVCDASSLAFRLVQERRHPGVTPPARWWFNFTAPYLAWTFPCRRFTPAVTDAST